VKLSEWARRNGVHYQAAWSWAKSGQVPVPTIKTGTGRYLVLEAGTEPAGRTVAYCRVSSPDQRDDLERQAGRVVTAATGQGLAVAEATA
jgi:putative resolvase